MPLQADVALQKLPPQNIEAEQMVLGAVLIENSAIETVSDVLAPEDFYKDAHRRIYEVMLQMADRKEAVDLITLTDALRHGGQLDKVGGASYLSILVSLVPTAANVKYHANIIHTKSVLRQLIHASTDIITQSYGDAPEAVDIEKLLDHAQQEILRISDKKRVSSFVPMREIVSSSFESIEQLYARKELVTGLPTGFTDLDKMTSGLQSGDLVIVAGRPSMGKTAFVLNVAAHAAMAESRKRIAFFSLEMTKEQLGLRMLCSEARIDAHKLRTGYVADADWGKLGVAAGRLAESPIFIDDTGGIGIFEMRSKARRLKADGGLDLIIVDYLQLMRGSGNADSREQEISGISRALKALAKELQLPVIALSQLNRAVETRGKDKRPMLADLRESGAIEQDADVILFIYRDEVYNKCECPPPPDGECSCGRRGTAEVVIGKQRNGPTGTVHLTFLHRFTRFENAESRRF